MSDDISILYKKVNTLTERVAELQSTRPFLRELVERNVASNEKLGETLHEVQISMAHMNEKMDIQAKAFEDLKAEMGEANKKTNDKIASLDKKVEAIEEKGKFDFVEYIKSNLPWIICILGLGMAYVSQHFKF